jgi:hypothetical protein
MARLPQKIVSRVCVASAFVAIPSTAAADAAPAWSVAASVGGTTDSLYGIGLGLRGGVRLSGDRALYLGARVVEQLGSSYVVDSGDSISLRYLFLGGEVGYEWTFGDAAIRPQVGIGVVHASATDTTYPATLDSNDLYVSPGIVATFVLAPPLFLGVELSLTKIFVTADDTTFLSYAAQVGVKF